jgi:hypothetical protein
MIGKETSQAENRTYLCVESAERRARGIDNRPQRDVGIRKNSVFSFESTLFSYSLRLLIPFLAVNADIA